MHRIIVFSFALFSSFLQAQPVEFESVGPIDFETVYTLNPGQLTREGGNFYIGLEHAEEGPGIYVLDRKANGSFGPPVRLGNICEGLESCYQPSASTGGQSVVFVSSPDNSWPGNNLYLSEKGKEGYTAPRELDEINEADVSDAYPWISADGKRLYFVKGSRLYRSSRSGKGRRFSPPREIDIEYWNRNLLSFWLDAREKRAYLLADNKIWVGKMKVNKGIINEPELLTDQFAKEAFISGISLLPNGSELIMYVSDEQNRRSIQRYRRK